MNRFETSHRGNPAITYRQDININVFSTIFQNTSKNIVWVHLVQDTKDLLSHLNYVMAGCQGTCENKLGVISARSITKTKIMFTK